MAITALSTASTGLSALDTALDITANNLANVNTNGFKASRANFEDLMYQHKSQPGVENANGDQRPAGLSVGLGTRISNTQFSFKQGSPISTDRDGDLMIDGEGFFQVTILPGQGDGIGYTRAGNFFKNSEGDLVLGNTDGPRLEPPINVPDNVLRFEVTSTGEVVGFTADDPAGQNLGDITLANFINPGGLQSIGGNIFIPSEASGPALEGQPGSATFGKLVQGFLESSNVDPVTELVGLIRTQRAFEMNSQTIQAADDVLQVIANLRR